LFENISIILKVGSSSHGETVLIKVSVIKSIGFRTLKNKACLKIKAKKA
tara:strand:+ start:94 stop:240 length:147 start_codon:yes stop_codon:yes gene_type:complete